MRGFGIGCDDHVVEQSYYRSFLTIVSVASLRLNKKMWLWENIQFLKNKFLVRMITNWLMEGKWNDWRIFALNTNLGDAVMVWRPDIWICSF